MRRIKWLLLGLIGLAAVGMMLVAGLSTLKRSSDRQAVLEEIPAQFAKMAMPRPESPAAAPFGADSAPGAPPAEAAAAGGAPSIEYKLEASRSGARRVAKSGLLGLLGGPVDGGEPKKPEEPNPYEQQEKRLIHYDGYAKLKVTKPTETVDQAVKLVTDAGGFVERLGSTSVTLRVPVEKFRDIFAQVLRLGDVLEKSLTAQDVTDAFMSVDLRLSSAKMMRDRLLQLLAMARTPEEKLELINRIKEVTEQIDELEAQLKTLASLASFSRLTLDLVAREALSSGPSEEDIAELRWIGQLSPFKRDVANGGGLLKLEVPRGMVALDELSHWIAESADGAVFWSSVRPNHPEGDTEFWIDAIKVRLEPEFASATVREAGKFKVLELVDRSEKPYRYLVAVHVEGDKLQLIEVYYPSAEHQARYGEAVTASIAKGG